MKSFSLPTTTTTTRSLSPSPSPHPPTFSPPPSYSTRRSRTYTSRLASLLQLLFLLLTTLLLVFAVATIACTASSLRHYHNTDLPTTWYLALWPGNLDLRPTRALLAIGVVAAVFSLVNIVLGALSLKPRCRPIHPLLHLLPTLLTALLIPITIFALSYQHVLNDPSSPSSSSPLLTGTLESWTCHFRAFAASAPMGFMNICRESHAAVGLMAMLLVLEVGTVGVGVGAWVVGRRAERERGGMGGGEKELEQFS